MRLLAGEKESILQIAHRYFGVNTEVILFGSRVCDDLRGGDIDLLIMPEGSVDHPYEQKLAFRSALKEEIGDQKIDVILGSRADSRLVVQHALLNGVEL